MRLIIRSPGRRAWAGAALALALATLTPHRSGAVPVLDVIQIYGQNGALLGQDSRTDSEDSIQFDLLVGNAAFLPTQGVYLLDPTTLLVADRLFIFELPQFPVAVRVTLEPSAAVPCPTPGKCAVKTAELQELTALLWYPRVPPASAGRTFFQSTVIPEPATGALLALGLLALARRSAAGRRA